MVRVESDFDGPPGVLTTVRAVPCPARRGGEQDENWSREQSCDCVLVRETQPLRVIAAFDAARDRSSSGPTTPTAGTGSKLGGRLVQDTGSVSGTFVT